MPCFFVTLTIEPPAFHWKIQTDDKSRSINKNAMVKGNDVRGKTSMNVSK